ncbi:MAG: hypothetical protein KGJ78_11680 [Alphaproteobacteria bacterium]|nr:hypothetical protein [Alphaproteobacteria bacterium]
MNKVWILAGLVPVVLGTLAFSHPSALPGALAQPCQIRVTRSGPVVHMEGVVDGPAGSRGEYRFILAKSGPNGDSQSGQGGEYVIGRSGETVVSTTELNVESGDHYRAVMLITKGSGNLSCSDAGD